MSRDLPGHQQSLHALALLSISFVGAGGVPLASPQKARPPAPCRLTYRCFWSHTELDGLSSGRRAPYQQLAHAIGLAHLDESTNLCLHPKYGAWWALRCLVVFDGVEWNGARKPVLPNPLHSSTQQLIKMTMRVARQPSGDWGKAGRGACQAPDAGQPCFALRPCLPCGAAA